MLVIFGFSVSLFHFSIISQLLSSQSQLFSYSEEYSSCEVSFKEDLSDANQQQQQLMGDQKTPPKSQATAMLPPPRKEDMKQETEKNTESAVIVFNDVSLVLDEQINIILSKIK